MTGFKTGVALVAAAAILACRSGVEPPASGEGATAIYLTDAPFPYADVAEVNVHIVNVELSTAADTSDAADWLEVAAPDQSYNLLSLQNGVATLLGSAVIPPADYRSLRLRLDTDRSSIVLRDGRVLRSITGSGPGIEWQFQGVSLLHAIIFDPLDVSQDGADIIMDFDVGMSFLQTTTDRFLFVPVVRAINRAAAGTVTGVVTGPFGAAGSSVPVEFATVEFLLDDLAGAPRVATAATDAAGHYVANHLMPRRYRVSVVYRNQDGAWGGLSQPISVATGGSATVPAIELSPGVPAPPPPDTIPGPAPPPPPPPDTLSG